MSRTNRRLVLATRGSRLAVTQAELIADLVRRGDPSVDVAIHKVTTKGDRDRRPFSAIGGRGLFVAEVEREVVEGRADAAVHSAKDLTLSVSPECDIVCIPARAAPHDVVLGGTGRTGEDALASLPPGAHVGTSSMRRRALAAEARPDLELVDLRGNLDTRLAKVSAGTVDAAILAAAGIARLGATPVEARPLDAGWWVPAPGQGALAVEARRDRDDLRALLGGLSDPLSFAEVVAERAFGERLEGGCSVPLGCLARAEGARMVVTGYLGNPLGEQGLRDRTSGPVGQARALGIELAEAILAAGGDDVLADIRTVDATEPSPP